MQLPSTSERLPPFFSSPRGLVIICALLWSTSGAFAKAPWFDNWPVETRGQGLAFWRAVFAVLAVAPFVRQPQFNLALIPMAGCFSLMVGSFLMSMVMGSEATTIWLQYIGPTWVGIAGYLGLGDRPRRADLPMMCMSSAAVVFIIAMQFWLGGESLQLQAAGLALFSGVMYAGVVISLRHLRTLDPAWLGLVNHSATVIVTAPFVIHALPIPQGAQWLAILFLGVVQIAIPYLLFAAAVKRMESAEASLLTLIEPIAVPIWTAVCWGHLATYRPPPWSVRLSSA
jgi:drug/metabolite transporter (DMT)-like permease